MMHSDVFYSDRQARITILFTWLISVLITLAFPIGYFLIEYLNASSRLESNTVASIEAIRHLDQKLLDKQHIIEAGDIQHKVGAYTLADGTGNIIATSLEYTLPSPTIEYSTTFDLPGNQSFSYTTYDSLRPTLLNTAAVSLIGLTLGMLSYLFVVKVPLKSMREAYEALALEREEKERALRRVEYSGQALRHLTSHDLLTDLPNRTYLESAIREFVNDSTRSQHFCALLMLDLNRFKDINDSLGHQTGDLVIREVSRRLRRIAPSPCTVARLDGDEFALFNPIVKNREDAMLFVNAILEALDEPLALKGYSLDTSATVGIAFYPDNGNTADALVQNADIAMHLAKRKRKDVEVFQQSEQNPQLDHLSLRGELKLAIEAGMLDVHYQPKIDMQTGNINGVEALARWTHPQRGFVSPALFIPIAEQTGLIHPLTGLIFNISLNQAAHWHSRKTNIGVAMNLSVRSLHDPHLPERISVLLETWAISPEMITLEITESAIMADPNKALDVLTELADMGIKVSIDDYGTGYSSLWYLKRLPVKEIKIDRTFVGDMMKNENDKVIVRATIDMAHDLGLKVTAEGVEDEATWNKLREFGCDNAQGFYMGKPQPASILETWLKESPWGYKKLA